MLDGSASLGVFCVGKEIAMARAPRPEKVQEWALAYQGSPPSRVEEHPAGLKTLVG